MSEFNPNKNIVKCKLKNYLYIKAGIIASAKIEFLSEFSYEDDPLYGVIITRSFGKIFVYRDLSYDPHQITISNII